MANKRKQIWFERGGECSIFGKKFKGIGEAAEHFGYSYQMMYKIFSGQNEPSDLICEMCGYKKVVTRKVRYVKNNNLDRLKKAAKDLDDNGF